MSTRRRTGPALGIEIRRIVWALLTVLLGIPVPVSAQEQEQPAIDQWLDELDEHVRAERDLAAIQVFQRLARAFDELEPGDGKKAARAIGRCLRVERAEDHDELYIGALEALASMGDEGEKLALRALRSKPLLERAEVTAAALLSLSTHENPRYVPTFAEFLESNEAPVVSAAAIGLGRLGTARDRIRKSATEVLIERYVALHRMGQPTPERNQRSAAARRLNMQLLRETKPSFQKSLEKLTGASEPDAPAWEAWFEEHRRRRWSDDDS